MKYVRRSTAAIAHESNESGTDDIEVSGALSYVAFCDKNSLDAFLDANLELRFARRRLSTALEKGQEFIHLRDC